MRGDPSPRVLLAHTDEHARASARAVEDLPKALQALRWSPLRRGSRTQLEVVERRHRLALRLALQVRRLARDLASFAHREDLRDEWAEAARRLPPIIDALAARLVRGPRRRGVSREVATAGERSPPISARTAARWPRSCAGRSCCCTTSSRGRARELADPSGEAAELAALRQIARRLGVGDDVRLLSPWAPLGDLAASDSGVADLLLRFTPVPVLAVTGSAGKTTTARLAEAMLRASGADVLTSHDAPADNAWPTAELLRRVLAARPPAWCVAELTSNHLAVCSAGPRIACITNVWPDHVDQHGSLEAYLAAKARIVAFQSPGDWTVVNADDPGAVALAAGSRDASSAARSVPPASDPGAGVEAGRLTVRLAGEAFDLGAVEALPPAPGAETGLLAGASALLAGASPDGIARALAGWQGARAAARAARRRRRLARHPRRARSHAAEAAAGLALHAPGSVVLIAGGHDDLGGGPMHSSAEEREQFERAAVVAAPGLLARRRLRPGGPAPRRGADGRRPRGRGGARLAGRGVRRRSRACRARADDRVRALVPDDRGRARVRAGAARPARVRGDRISS